jgi:hypothetical protein
MGIHIEGSTVWSEGLRQKIGRELRLELGSADREDDARDLLQLVADYVAETDARLHPGETFEYGYAMLLFKDAGTFLDVWERAYEPDADTPGASRSMRIWREQHRICEQHGVPFTPVRLSDRIAISPGVLQSGALEGVRYNLGTESSGWIVTTKGYDGDVHSMLVEHLYHVTAARPEIVAYLALPRGFRFTVGSDESHAWFDPSVEI